MCRGSIVDVFIYKVLVIIMSAKSKFLFVSYEVTDKLDLIGSVSYWSLLMILNIIYYSFSLNTYSKSLE